MRRREFIGLMGGAYREVQTPAGLYLLPAEDGEPDLRVPASDYVLTIDAEQRVQARPPQVGVDHDH